MDNNENETASDKTVSDPLAMIESIFHWHVKRIAKQNETTTCHWNEKRPGKQKRNLDLT